jgi:hypothetical protein
MSSLYAKNRIAQRLAPRAKKVPDSASDSMKCELIALGRLPVIPPPIVQLKIKDDRQDPMQ